MTHARLTEARRIIAELAKYAPGAYLSDPRPDAAIDSGKDQAFEDAQRFLSAPADAAYAPSEPSGARMEMSDEWTQEVFSKRMLKKLDASSAKGRSGWQSCSQEKLSRMLREHVDKGDPVDVANFCMFLDALGFGIAPAAQSYGDLPARFPEINFSNYGEQEVEALQAWAFEALDQIQAASLTNNQQRQAVELLNLAEHALSHASLNAVGDVVEHTQDRRDHMRVQIIAFLKALGTLQLAAQVNQSDESATCAKSQVELQAVPVSPCDWTDRQILDFLGVALRNVDLVGAVYLSEIRQGFEYMRDKAISDRAEPTVDAVAINTSWMTDAELDAICQPGSGNKAKRRIEAINKARGEA